MPKIVLTQGLTIVLDYLHNIVMCISYVTETLLFVVCGQKARG